MDMVESNVPMQAWMAGGWGRAHGHGGVVRAGSWVRHGRVEGVEVLKAEDIEDADASVDFRLGDGDRLIDLLHAPGQAGAKRGPSGGGGVACRCVAGRNSHTSARRGGIMGGRRASADDASSRVSRAQERHPRQPCESASNAMACGRDCVGAGGHGRPPSPVKRERVDVHSERVARALRLRDRELLRDLICPEADYVLGQRVRQLRRRHLWRSGARTHR